MTAYRQPNSKAADNSWRRQLHASPELNRLCRSKSQEEGEEEEPSVKILWDVGYYSTKRVYSKLPAFKLGKYKLVFTEQPQKTVKPAFWHPLDKDTMV